jgi:hypothetical protein
MVDRTTNRVSRSSARTYMAGLDVISSAVPKNHCKGKLQLSRPILISQNGQCRIPKQRSRYVTGSYRCGPLLDDEIRSQLPPNCQFFDISIEIIETAIKVFTSRDFSARSSGNNSSQESHLQFFPDDM